MIRPTLFDPFLLASKPHPIVVFIFFSSHLPGFRRPFPVLTAAGRYPFPLRPQTFHFILILCRRIAFFALFFSMTLLYFPVPPVLFY